MTIKHAQWKTILNAINEEKGLNKGNVISKIQERLKLEDKNEYEEWRKVGFDVNHLFNVNKIFFAKPPFAFYRFGKGVHEYTLLSLAILSNLENVVKALSGIREIDVNSKNQSGWISLHY